MGLFDLDGVVYLGAEPVPYAVAAINAAQASGQRAAYVTNNASRSAASVAEQLTALGLTCAAGDVVTSAQAAVRLLRELIAPGAQVLVVGAPALVDQVAAAGFMPVRAASRDVRAVVQGHDPATDWALLAEATVALRAGARWVAANEDSTLPSPRGPLPGNGAMVAALRTATGLRPTVAGKPQAPLLRPGGPGNRCASGRCSSGTAWTPTSGARCAGRRWTACWCSRASPDLDEVLQAAAGSRPSYLSADLRGLAEVSPSRRDRR